MRCAPATLLLFLTLWTAAPARCQITEVDHLSLDLTKPVDQHKVLMLGTGTDGFSLPFTATDQGLGWDAPANRGAQAISIETAPIAVGLAWRTTSSVTISADVVTLKPMPSWYGEAHFYLRYSPDYRHWSEWQDIHQTNPVAKPSAGLSYEGNPAVPAVARLPYDLLLQQYEAVTRSNDDEEDSIRWIL